MDVVGVNTTCPGTSLCGPGKHHYTLELATSSEGWRHPHFGGTGRHGARADFPPGLATSSWVAAGPCEETGPEQWEARHRLLPGSLGPENSLT